VIVRTLLRAGNILVLCVGVGALRWATTAPLAAVRAGHANVDELVGLSAALVCWGLFGWIALVLTLTALGSIPRGIGRLATAVGTRLCPVVMRRAVRLAVGVTVLAGPVALTSPASAEPMSARAATTDHPGAVSDAVFLPDVSRPGWSGAASAAPTQGTVGTRSPSRDVTTVVAPGDCLWTIAAAHLGHGANNAEIAAEWPRWYAANRRIIGADPDLLLPGMVLRAPAEG